MENFRSTKNFIENTCASVADVAGKKCLTGKGRLEAARNCHRERYISTWFIFDICSTVPFYDFLFIDHKESGVGFKLLSMLRLWHLRRVGALFARLEKDIHFNYFWTRYAKLISVTLFAVHCAGCTNYVIADRYPDTKKTWIGAANPNFKEDSL
ncbi:hypothetical protein T459_19178 [Capsicum annuum]|uniref:Ion transport domain-containing protein n=1 Tax=Capsicum annuum TaxID=4072 RepID=A0A2G2Z0Y4_CAPAN|nr:hypothetical protein T459_19178 [Capsicum annuum]